MRKSNFTHLAMIAGLLMLSANIQAQSLKDLLNRENVEKAINAITGNKDISMEGTWTYDGAAIKFESDNVLAQAGGAVASNTLEEKLSEQLSKIGFQEGKMSFTFNADSTFQARLKNRDLKGTYSYDRSTGKVNLKLAKLIGLNATLECTSSQMDLLFNFDKLLDLVNVLSDKSNNSTLQTIGTLTKGYDGMLMGFSLKKQ